MSLLSAKYGHTSKLGDAEPRRIARHIALKKAEDYFVGKSHRNHHFVPRFLLEEWAGADRKLTYFNWRRGGELHVGRCGPRGVGAEEHLYSQRQASGEMDPEIEVDVFGKIVDTPGSLVHKKLLAGELNRLTTQEEKAWSNFLVAQMIRVPSMVQYLRDRGRQLLLRDIEGIEPPDDIKEQLGQLTLQQYLESDGAWLLDNASLRALQVIIESQTLNSVFLGATWAVCDVSDSNLNLVIGDRPLLQEGKMSEQYLFMLPLSPTIAFVASNQVHAVQNLSAEKSRNVVMTFNKEATQVADTHVYATGREQESMIARYLRKATAPDDRHVVSGLREALAG
ncbi:DUF4238 domain-containing protein [Burkholderia cepacia]|uniref:DUF4238 domain-containing protein n=1 Tax=Burkholderia cepacia TaxID=292 RepID=UPI00157566B7|nr:DUF4238 domain-containing protein [Burkholderia cepacia]